MNYNQYIDHTVLLADTTKSQIEKLCEEARKYNFASVCVNTYWVQTCSNLLQGSNVKVCCVVGFPLGACTTATKAFETTQAIENGASEIDMVLNIGALKDKDYVTVVEDIKAVVLAAKGNIVKVILENCLLTKEEIKKACALCVEAKAHFVKTSTGFNRSGATIEDVKLMSQTVNGQALVKAAGGVRTPQDLKEMIEAGANRIGTSSGVKLVNNEDASQGY